MAAPEDYPTPNSLDELRSLLDTKLQTIKDIVADENGWTQEKHSEKAPNEDIVLMTKPLPGSNSAFLMVKIKATFNVPAEEVVKMLATTDVEQRKKISPDANDIKLLEVNEDTRVWMMRAASPFPISDRESVVGFRSRKEDSGAFWFWGTSVGHKDCAVTKSYVRAITSFVGFSVVPTGAGSCVVTRVAHVDPKGMIPSKLVNMFVVKQAHVFTVMREALGHK